MAIERPKDWKNEVKATIHGTKPTGRGLQYPLYTLQMKLTERQMTALMDALDQEARKTKDMDSPAREMYSLLDAALISADRTYYPYEE